jgi:hypothetical protein
MKFLTFTTTMFILLAFSASGWGQDQGRNCGTMTYLELQKLQDPKQESRMERIEHFTQNMLRQNKGRAVTGVITIPVVVHVVYNTAAENISDAQILSQIAILNEDFRRTNSDADNVWSQAADSEFEFCLATRDPNGNATTGITRTSTSRTSFSSNNAVKFNSNGGKDAWPAADYLNIWVCDLNGLLGYAQFPGGSASTDGIVCDYAAFGNVGAAASPFDLGRTATHEIGHWLNLRHIWGDGGCSVDDFVSDTPVSDAANTGCATGHVSCSTVDMVQNYMDYSDDACMNLFTQGQKDRMRVLFEPGGARAGLLNSLACQAPAPPSCNDGIQNGNETGVDCGGSCPNACATCNDGIQNGNETGVDCGGSCGSCSCTDNAVTLTLKLDNYPEETSWTLTTAAGSTVASGGTYGNQSPGATITENFCLPDGCYVFTISDTYGDGICCGYGNGSYSLNDANGALASGGSFSYSESTNFCVGGGGTGPTCSDGIQNGNETGIDCGGPDCAPCTTCNDGIQNGDETGIDCGGSCPNTCGGGSSSSIFGHYFESGWDGWSDGGSDCARYAGSNSYEGTYSIQLRDNSGTASAMTSPSFNAGAYDQLELEFYFYAVSMENGEDFWVRYYDGSTWRTLATYAAGSSFNNNNFYVATVTVSRSQYNFPSNARFRFQCDASANSDYVYIDAVTLSGSSGSRLPGETPKPEISLLSSEDPGNIRPPFTVAAEEEEPAIGLYPNPVREVVHLKVPADLKINAVKIYDVNGRLIKGLQHVDRIDQLPVSDLQSGLYILSIETPDRVINKRFVKH